MFYFLYQILAILIIEQQSSDAFIDLNFIM